MSMQSYVSQSQFQSNVSLLSRLTFWNFSGNIKWNMNLVVLQQRTWDCQSWIGKFMVITQRKSHKIMWMGIPLDIDTFVHIIFDLIFNFYIQSFTNEHNDSSSFSLVLGTVSDFLTSVSPLPSCSQRPITQTQTIYLNPTLFTNSAFGLLMVILWSQEWHSKQTLLLLQVHFWHNRIYT